MFINEWQRIPVTRALIAHLRELEGDALKAAVKNRRDPQISLQKLERASLLAEILDLANNGTFIK